MKPMKTRRNLIQLCLFCALLLSALASAQNLFVLGSTNTFGFPPTGFILEFSPTGSENTFVSGLTLSSGLGFDTAGNLFEADNFSGNIYEFTNQAGVLSSNRVAFATGLYEPQGLAFDSVGNLFEVDLGSHIVNTGIMHKFTPSGVGSVFASGLNPTALAIDRSNNVYVTDIESMSIYEFTPNGAESTFVSGLHYPIGLAFDSEGDLFEADADSGNIYEFLNSGGVLSSNYIIFASGLSSPLGLVFDSTGNLFETDYDIHGNINKFTTGGIRSTFASGLSYPRALAFQPIPELQAFATNGTVQITVSMPSPYYSTIIQASTNLGNWFNIYTNTPPFTFTNSMTTIFPNCFYRALLGH
jgi:sugar lactone lactonase YvrE